MLKIGCAEKKLKVPLFAELFGYGPFAGRRNLGENDPLFCRVAIFDDGQNAVAIIYSDICLSSKEVCDPMRDFLSQRFDFKADNIAFTATHTHSAPFIGSVETFVGMGTSSPEFKEIWQNAATECFEKALADLEAIPHVLSGRAPAVSGFAQNRTTPDSKPVDPEIRYLRFMRQDGSCKLFLHNYAMHGTSFSGMACYRYVSADWMGAANRRLKEEKLADYAIFLQGAAGDINPRVAPEFAGTGMAPDSVAEKYMNDLKADFSRANEIKIENVRSICRYSDFPSHIQSPGELRKDADKIRRATAAMGKDHQNWADNIALRLEETALMLERGDIIASHNLMQTFLIGECAIYFIPGELFVEAGAEILRRSPLPFSMVSTCSNQAAGYIFTRQCAEKYPDIADYGKEKPFGYYEVYSYMHGHNFKFKNNIADFVVEAALKGIEK